MAMDNLPVGARLTQWMARPAAPAVLPENDMSVRRPVGAQFQAWLGRTLGVQNPGTPMENAVTNARGVVPAYPVEAPAARPETPAWMRTLGATAAVIPAPVAALLGDPLPAIMAATGGPASLRGGKAPSKVTGTAKSEVIDSKAPYEPDRRENFIRELMATGPTANSLNRMMQAAPYIRPVPMHDIAIGQFLQAANADLFRQLNDPNATDAKRNAAIESHKTLLAGVAGQSALMGNMMMGMPRGAE